MADISPINADLPSLIDEVTQAPDTISQSCKECINSSNSTDELKDKLTILEKSIGASQSVQPIREILSMIENNKTLTEIKSSHNI